MKDWKLILSGLLAATITVSSMPAGAQIGFRMRIWMQPPMDTTGDNACLGGPSDLWHGTFEEDDFDRALDWQSACGETVTKIVRFRAFAAAPDDGNVVFVGATGEPVQRPAISCGTGTVRYARVLIKAVNDGLLKGRMHYQHLDLTTSALININFQGNTWLQGAKYNSVNIGDTVNDSGAGSDCWAGWHVHETNSDLVPNNWTAWNTARYDAPGDRCDCHQNNTTNPETWTRRLNWTDV
jgi:hypothetical protein